MHYQEIIPDSRLRHYIKCYYYYESSSAVAFEDTVFPSGSMEIIFNLGSGHWQTAAETPATAGTAAAGTATAGEKDYQTTPPVELWGQITQPLPIRSLGQNTMMGIRFLPHGAALFLDEKADEFNNRVVDYCDIAGKPAATLHQQLLGAGTQPERITLIETFLLNKLEKSKIKPGQLSIVHDIMRELRRQEVAENIDTIATRYGISSRYLQKLFLQHTGLTPKLYSKIHRFQHSLHLITKNESPLTSIAYDCGYFDQSHFIREFKSFTGLTPSGYSLETSSLTGALAS
ncbi:MAG TPA: helix-turn-helix domain-containing protein [Puia sp.]|nr:helix-turn-helix domain-containing protein [Puia sp.]